MDEAVEHGPEEGGTSGDVLHPDPPKAEHGGVVVDVKEGQLVAVLSNL